MHGHIEGVGPRYCPSIEDKVVKFAEKEHHQIFLEPEGRHTEEVYVNGVSTSLPMEVQYALHSHHPRPGERRDHASRLRRRIRLLPAHAALPHAGNQASPAVSTSPDRSTAPPATKKPRAQGLDRRCKCRAQGPGQSRRSSSPAADAYIGVLIDDLVTKGTPEPYRMFTSRAEHRLLLRHDNADLRLTPLAHSIGLADPDRFARVQAKEREIAEVRSALRTMFDGVRLDQWLKRPENDALQLPSELRRCASDDAWRAVELELKYAGYIARQQSSIERQRSAESTRIPTPFDYARIEGLRAESRQKLAAVRPETLGQASRISGVTPADIALLSIVLRRSTDCLNNVTDSQLNKLRSMESTWRAPPLALGTPVVLSATPPPWLRYRHFEGSKLLCISIRCPRRRVGDATPSIVPGCAC